ncbi:MAG: alpha/beta hydrolase [Robiginitomaculum sp.]|nr:MAG: alpha/beta hydrolase [Robiginitomaculum sp.]
MFEPFPGNYIWSLSVNIALSMGGEIGEIDIANRKVVEAAKAGGDSGTQEFFRAWCEMAENVATLAAEDEAMGRNLSASKKYRRAVAYYIACERMQDRDYEPRKVAYQRMLELRDKMILTGKLNCEVVTFPYESNTLSGLFIQAEGGTGSAPCMIHCNGLDSIKEMLYLCETAQELSKRGISSLLIDQPGVGEALRLEGLHAIHNSEKWASAAVDYLEARPEVDANKIGIVGISLGGYYAPRAAAFEPRLALCVSWGGNHDWGEIQRRRLRKEGDHPVPHYWNHVLWVWGQPDLEAFLEYTNGVCLDGVIEKIQSPYLVTHGSGDRQIPVEFAHKSYDQAVNSVHREIRVFTEREGGVEHVAADNMEPTRSFICDWISEQFARNI